MIDLQKYIQNSYNLHSGLWDIQAKMQCDILEFLFKNFEGDILEIGAHEGYHTLQFLKIAQKYNRKVFVIDPYDGQQEGNESVYQTFVNNTKDFDNLVFLRKMSQSTEAEEFISKNKFIYIFIDGLHTIPALESDLKISLKSLLDSGVICIDDTETDGFENYLQSFVSSHKELRMISRPSNHEEPEDISNRIQERLEKIGINNFGIFNPGHKKMEFLIKNK